MTTESEILKKLSESKVLVAYFSQESCSVCKVLRPKVETIVGNYSNLVFRYIDTTKYPNLSGQNMIFTIPTILLFFRGKEVKRWSRYLSIEEIKSELDRYEELARGSY
jgi:thioredoxin-like negative regulator of GroEL